MNKLSKIFEKDPYAYPDSIICQDGFDDYVEDVCWGENKCSEENKERIRAIMYSHNSQLALLKQAVDFERKNGKGSNRQAVQSAVKNVKVPDELKKFLEMT